MRALAAVCVDSTNSSDQGSYCSFIGSVQQAGTELLSEGSAVGLCATTVMVSTNLYDSNGDITSCGIRVSRDSKDNSRG